MNCLLSSATTPLVNWAQSASSHSVNLDQLASSPALQDTNNLTTPLVQSPPLDLIPTNSALVFCLSSMIRHNDPAMLPGFERILDEVKGNSDDGNSNNSHPKEADELDFNEEIRNLTVCLTNESPNSFKTTWTTQNPCAFEIVEAILKKEKMKGLRSQPTHQSKQAKTGESGHESNSNLPHLDVDLDYAEEHLSHVAELVNEPPEVHIDSDSHVDLESNSKVDENSQFEPNLEGTWLQKQWMHQVRKEVVKEMNDHKGTYTKLQGGEPSLIEIIGNLNVKNVAATIEGSQWLDKLAHGQAIANTYVRPIVFLS
ncbi:hypothetical protein MJO29_016155, partial [Puccinia striiformis f. sp. tritici]